MKSKVNMCTLKNDKLDKYMQTVIDGKLIEYVHCVN